MSAAHTPGPWRLSSEHATIIKQDMSCIGSDAGLLIGSSAGHPNSGFYPTTEEAVANARLMAAAPDLLNELINLTARFKAAVIQAGTDEEFAEHAVQSARAAIARATGGQS